MSDELHPVIAEVCDHFAAHMLADWSGPLDDFNEIMEKHASHLIPHLIQGMYQIGAVPFGFEPDDECLDLMVARIVATYAELYAQSFVSAETT